jgi:putative transposase
MSHNMWTEITRSKYERAGRRYASDVTDAEWRLIEPFMPPVKRLAVRGKPTCALLSTRSCILPEPAANGACCRRTTIGATKTCFLFERINFELLL